MKENFLTVGIYMFVYIAFVFILGWPVMTLWNACLVPAVFSLCTISYMQAVGILVLSSILFKSTSWIDNRD